MRRREFIMVVGGAAASPLLAPLAARAQEAVPLRRIGVMMQIPERDPEVQARLAVLVRDLQDLGWTQGRHYRIDYRGGTERVRADAAELIGLRPDIILAVTGLIVQELQRQTRTIPIVFVNTTDVVEIGIVPSLAHPGGNTTGFAGNDSSIAGKWFELLKEIAPGVKRVLVMANPGSPGNLAYRKVLESAAPLSGVQISSTDIRNAVDVETAIEAHAREPDAGLIVLPGGPITGNRMTIIALAARRRLPAVYPQRYYVTEGGLVTYGVEILDLWRRAASYVDRILKGENPANLPVQAPIKFNLTINLKTAKAIGLKISEAFLLRADEVIE